MAIHQLPINGYMAHEAEPTSPLARVAALAGATLVATGVVVFFGGWIAGVDSLKNLIPGAVGMKASTATALIACGAALVIAPSPAVSSRRKAASRLLGLVPLAIGLAFLSEYVLGWNLGIDEFPFVDQVGREQGIAYPGRLAPTTAVNFVLAGAALLLTELRLWRGWRLAELLALPVALIASASVIAYAYEIPAFYGPGAAAKMAVNTALCFVSLTIGLIVARPRGHLVRLATTTDPGGMMVRRVLPLAVLLPLVLGWLELRGLDAGLFGAQVGTWWLTAATIAVLVLLIWRVAALLSRADAGRKVLEAELYRMANTDAMTSLVNRHRFDEELSRQLKLTARHDEAAALLVLDLDRMKSVNDGLGHQAGDELLKAIACLMRERLRTSDVCGRLGGDEFGILLPQTSEEGALTVAEGLVEGVRGLVVETERGDAWTTISVGVTDLRGVGAVDDALALADHAMYQAKGEGGDAVRVEMHPGTLPSVAPGSIRPPGDRVAEASPHRPGRPRGRQSDPAHKTVSVDLLPNEVQH